MARINIDITAQIHIDESLFTAEIGRDGRCHRLIRKSDGHQFTPQMILEHLDDKENQVADLATDSEMAAQGFENLDYHARCFEDLPDGLDSKEV